MSDTLLWGGYPLAGRHWDVANKSDSTIGYLFHSLVALIEYCPFLGTLAALIDQWVQTFFQEEVREVKEKASLPSPSMTPYCAGIPDINALDSAIQISLYDLPYSIADIEKRLFAAGRLGANESFKEVVKSTAVGLQRLGLTPSIVMKAYHEVGKMAKTVRAGKIAEQSHWYEGRLIVKSQECPFYVEGFKPRGNLLLEMIPESVLRETSTIIEDFTYHVEQITLTNVTKNTTVSWTTSEYHEFTSAGFLRLDKALSLVSVLSGIPFNELMEPN